MIRLPDVALPSDRLRELDALQAEIDALATYPERVTAAKARFGQRNTARDPLFGVVRETLERMCHGPRRCGYCEDSAADEVEHVRPKDLYPELAFAWENYLYACGPCNGPKNNRFAVFSHTTGALVDVTRRRGAPVREPEAGDPVLIHPRQEDPLQWMELDLVDTFYFIPIGAPGSRDHQRAEYTIEVLRLNKREFLAEARRAAFGNYFRLAADYVRARDAGDPQAFADADRSLRGLTHRTVWKEMQRQHSLPRLHDLFKRAPELFRLG
ncbi:hypothetical protein [Longimicrobium sp.]|uniref:hypothetical protein n=1 Tax=Longimicrobium sp. TaxID=2029185 RepID=UPI002E359C20|nr:hypothetical protein [Longimicrobium sp.]HEX6041042.1 hypothetical protein [Longimicrobium sp.]